MKQPQILSDLSARHAADTPDATCCVDGADQLTWAKFHNLVLKIAGLLTAERVERNDCIAYLGRNSILYYALLQASLRIGTVLLPINWRLSDPEIEHILRDSGARFLMVDDEFASINRSELLDPNCGDPRRFVSNEDVLQKLDSIAPVGSLVEAAPDAPIMLLYTSGTTGFPKGVLLSHRNLIAGFTYGLSTNEEWGEWTSSTRSIVSTPVYHIAGTRMLIHALIGGSTSIILRSGDIEPIARAIEDCAVDKVFLVPTMLASLVSSQELAPHDLSSVRTVLYGASPISKNLLSDSIRALPNASFVQLYGATETAGVATWLSAIYHTSQTNARMESCGKAYDNTGVKVVGGAGETLAPGQLGEVLLRSDCVMLGYLGRAADTAEAIVDGWYHTGDVGRLDHEGYLYLIGRSKDVIISGGENIYAAEVERVILEHPSVHETAVIGIAHPKWGEIPKAFIVLHKGKEVTDGELMNFARGSLASYKIPREIEFIDVLPRNSLGKIVKSELYAAALHGPQSSTEQI